MPAPHDVGLQPVATADETVLGAAPPDPVATRRSRRFAYWLAVAWLAVIVFFAMFADVLPLTDPEISDPLAGRAGPSLAHPLGADQLGRDLLSRVAFGARVSLLVGVLATAIGFSIGGTFGLVAGYVKGKTDTLIMGGVDVMLAFPALIFAMALTAFLGASVRNITLAIGILAIPAFTRISRASALTVSEREFVLASRGLGARTPRILLREIAPNVVPSLAAYALVIVAVAIIVEASLSFLGLGVPPPQPTWGGLISSGKPDLGRAPHISLIPAGVMFLTVLSLNFLGEEFQQRFGARS
jgi:peptide/nickel transport system permease protein